MIYAQQTAGQEGLSDDDLRDVLFTALEALPQAERVLAIPPDFSRFHSRAGVLTEAAWRYYGTRLADILPAIGTHAPMSDDELSAMFGATPRDLFRVHNWRDDVVTLGDVPAEFVAEATAGRISVPWPAQVNRMLVEGGYDRILSIGQVVPHEVIGMANYNKNIFVGTGGSDGINKSHFISAVCGIENILGRADNPVRSILNYASEHFARDLPITYVHTVIGIDESGRPLPRGIFVGDDIECFHRAAELAQELNVFVLDRQPRKVIAYMDPGEFKSTWLANKAVYRTRMAIADGGELVVIAPGLKEFGEDRDIDALIRRYGYCGTERVMEIVQEDERMRRMLGAAAHLVHGSSEGRFEITYAPGHLSKAEIESAGYEFLELHTARERYRPESMAPGWNTLPTGEEVYYVPNPALGLWAHGSRFAR